MTVVKITKQKTENTVSKKLKFGNYKICLEATQVRDKIGIDSINENDKEFLKNNKSILKIQQMFKSEKHNVFTEEINKIALSSNDDKRMQSIDSLETYAYGTSNDLVSDKEEIKCNNIIKWCKKWA